MLNKLSSAALEWQSLLGQERVKIQTEDLKRYQADTSRVERVIGAVLLPKTRDEVVAIVKIAALYGVALYPISKGNNWGHGSANPVMNDCVIVDLSQMNALSRFDTELGIITIEPGVTQGQLSDFLLKNGDFYLTPTTSAGPNATILGNALERGFGLVPVSDHFLSIMNLEVVLADGSVYHSAIHAKGCADVCDVFKWGIGPYIDGIFSQSNFGIVTAATIALKPKQDCMEIFIIEFIDQEDLESAVVIVRKILKELGCFASAISIVNDLRLSAMNTNYPFEVIKKNPQQAKAILRKLAQEGGFPPWACVGSLYAHRYVVDAVKKELKKLVGHKPWKIQFVSKAKAGMIEAVLDRLPKGMFKTIRNRIDKINMTLDLASGRPREEVLHICYRQLPGGVPQGKTLNPAQDGCGIYWYVPFLPMQADIVNRYVNFVEATCDAYGIEPMIVLTSLSERCFASPIPIVFDPKNIDQAKRAKDCLNALIEGGRAIGVYPHRLGIEMMEDVVEPEHAFWAVQQSIKDALDPQNIMSPGRYSR